MGCKTCGCALSERNATGFCRPHFSAGRAAGRVKPEPRRCPCGAEIGRRNRTGLCLTHMLGQRNADPIKRDAMKKGIRRRLSSDPMALERARERARKLHTLPQSIEACRRRWNPDWHRKGVEAMLARPDLREAANRKMSATKLAWCPPHLRDEYRHLTQRKGFLHAEARQMIEDQNEIEMARWRRSIGIVDENEIHGAVVVSIRARALTPFERAMAAAGSIFDVTEAQILSPERSRHISIARYALAVVLQNAGYSTPKIAAALNRSDHTSAIHWLKRADWYSQHNAKFAKQMAHVLAAWSDDQLEAA
jgi:hypothetical protein